MNIYFRPNRTIPSGEKFFLGTFAFVIGVLMGAMYRSIDVDPFGHIPAVIAVCVGLGALLAFVSAFQTEP